ncbi:MAG: TonB-dependent receptor [Myxococcales bacterium]|jgi:iron complex outermembrane receptor protein/hemoglobin/transferrin/lactoferrin receptor protein
MGSTRISRGRRRASPCGALYLALLLSAHAHAQGADEATPAEADGEEFGAHARFEKEGSTDEALARSVVTRTQMQERMPRSAPDALRYEPGVSIQQTAHGQASPYVRGLTGQQVVHAFDGIRMNNGIYRRGPNQYFFTVDSATLDRLEVVRGSASTRFGSDALGGAILAYPRSARLDPEHAFSLRPRVFGRATTADGELGGRAELEASLWGRTALLAGVGYRDVDRLESSGAVQNPGQPPALVPRFEPDGRTQLGTGFRVATLDARLTHQLRPGVTLLGAIYTFRQHDSPRTDQCPPPEAPIDECLVIREQLRTLGYAALRGDAGDYLRDFDLNVSLQTHGELRVRERPRSLVEARFDDRLRTLGASFRAATRRFAGEAVDYRVRYGADAYRDSIESSAEQRFTDLGDEGRFAYPRGQYLDGSIYVRSGVFAELQLWPWPWLSLRGGGRLAAVGASAPSDPESDSSAISRQWGATVARAGVEAAVLPELSLHLNYDQGFRAPNLDDLTSRQQVGPGFQFENAGLSPETSDTVELGLRAAPAWLEVDAWIFATVIDDAITRTVRGLEDCPRETDACRASRTQFQLVNAGGRTLLWGSDGGVTAHLPADVTLRATWSYAWGEGPNLSSREQFGDRVPVSRVPPLNGTVEARYRHLSSGLYGGAAMRWALAQDRLASSDYADARIPPGGTPGYAVFDLRAGLRLPPHLRLSLLLENLFDTPHRVHGSSINGPGRGAVAELTLSY